LSTQNSPQSEGSTPPAVAKGKDATRKAVIGLAAAVAVAVGAGVITYFVSEADAYVGVVNGHKISRDEFNRDLEIRKRQYSQRMGVDFNSANGQMMLGNLRGEIVEQLVQREVLLQGAADKKLTATDPEVETRLKSIKTSFPDENAFQKALQDNGISAEALKSQIRDSIVIEKLRDDLTKGATVSLEDAQAFYDKQPDHFAVQEEVKASHILVKTEEKAKELSAKIKGGADFAQVARDNSEDTGSKSQGGDLGFFGKGRMVPEFEKAAFALKPGQMSGPVKSQFGYHIIKVTDRHEPKTKTFEEVKSEIIAEMLRGKKDESFRDWVSKQRAAAKIAIRPQYQPATPSMPAGMGGMPPGHPPTGGNPHGGEGAPVPAHK